MSSHIDQLSALAYEWDASDLFLAAGQPGRLKVKGVIHEREGLHITEQDMLDFCQSCGVNPVGLQDYDTAWYSPAGVRFRVNLHRRTGRLGAVLRQIRSDIATMDELGLPTETLMSWLQQRSGLILVSGPTGCGKSTTVGSCLEWLSSVRSGHYITIEEPIEYIFKDRMGFFTQREVGVDTPDYETGLKNSLRQAPDVIFLGEIRQPETAMTCLQAAETGHLVISTMHTASVTEVFDRIVNLIPGVERDAMLSLLSQKLIGVLSQRLLPRLDAHGQVAVCEYLTVNGAVREWIRKLDWAELSDHMKRGDDPGNRSLIASLVAATKGGYIDPELAATHAGNPFEFHRTMRGIS